MSKADTAHELEVVNPLKYFDLGAIFQSAREARVTIGLAVSGGGFRASLFHLGVIRRLRAEDSLNKITCITSVSGGSIAAAHLVVNWDRYNSDPDEFDRAAQELIDLTKIDVRGRIQRRLAYLWLLAMLPVLPSRWRLSPTNLLARYYERRLFKGTCAADIVGKNRPSLYILSTNLSEATLTCFGKDKLLNVPFDEALEPAEIEAKIIPLSYAVAASSAYPGFFPPLALTDADLGAREGTIGRQYFTDAGIYDNLGLYGLRRVAPEGLERIIVSDAGRSFVPQKEAEFGILRTALRAVDIFMFRIRMSDLAWKIQGTPVTLISISQDSDVVGASSTAVQSQLENIRTDLDKFSDLEIAELIRHGYYSTAQALSLARGEIIPPSFPNWDLPKLAAVAAAENVIARKLQSSAKRRWRLFSYSDWISWAHAVVGLAMVASLVALSPLVVDSANSFVAGIRAYPLIRYDPPEWTDPSPVAIEAVPEILRPTNEGFQVFTDDRVWDLRRLQRGPSTSANQILGPATLTRVSTLLRQSSDAKLYKYLYQTVSDDFLAWSPNKDFRVKLLRSQKSEPTHLNTYELQLDVSAAPLNTKFLLEAQSRTLGALWDRNNSWLGMSITDPVSSASMRIIFPKDLPYKRPSFRKYPNDSVLQAESFDGIVLDRITEKELLWRVDNPQVGWTYRVQWDWE